MYKVKTKVIFDGIFWRVMAEHCGSMIRTRDLHLTRADARKAAKHFHW